MSRRAPGSRSRVAGPGAARRASATFRPPEAGRKWHQAQEEVGSRGQRPDKGEGQEIEDAQRCGRPQRDRLRFLQGHGLGHQLAQHRVHKADEHEPTPRARDWMGDSSPSAQGSDMGLDEAGQSRLAQPAQSQRRLALSGIRAHLDSFCRAHSSASPWRLCFGLAGEPALASLIEPMSDPWADGLNRHPVSGPGRGVRAQSALLHAVLGELVPKAVALQKTEPVALWAAAPLRVFYLLTFPLSGR